MRVETTDEPRTTSALPGPPAMNVTAVIEPFETVRGPGLSSAVQTNEAPFTVMFQFCRLRLPVRVQSASMRIVSDSVGTTPSRQLPGVAQSPSPAAPVKTAE